jgi:hypothetical protein
VPRPSRYLPPPHLPISFDAELSNSNSDGDNDNNDISRASFDIRNGALASDSKLKVIRQKANLEAKLNAAEPMRNPQPPAGSLTHANEGAMNYSAASSFYIREDCSNDAATISIQIEYFPNLSTTSRRRDRSLFHWM